MLKAIRHISFREHIRSTCTKTNLTSTKPEAIQRDELNNADSYKFCIGHVKKFDRENYLAALCISDPLIRRAVICLRAFNVELSLVRDSTTNSDRAKVRFLFWSRLVEEIVRRNKEGDSNVDKLKAYYNYTPVAKELLELFYLTGLSDESSVWLNDLIGARVSSKVLGYKSFESIDELELYCSKSNSSLYQLAVLMSAQFKGIENSHSLTSSFEAAKSLGIAHGISNVIRGIPYNSTKNCCYIPKNLLTEYQLTSRDFIGKNLDGKRIAPLVKDLACKCQTYVDSVYLTHRDLPNFIRELFLPRIAIQSNLNKLRKCDYDVCNSAVNARNEMLPLSLWLGSKYFRSPVF